MKFKYVIDGTWVSECESCGAQAPLAKVEYSNVPFRGEYRNICEVCYKTSIGRNTERVNEETEIFRVIAQVANHIIDITTSRNSRIKKLEE